MRSISLLIITALALQISAAPLEERQNLDPLGSFLSSVFAPAATTTTAESIIVATTTDEPKTTTKGKKGSSTTSESTTAVQTSTTAPTDSSTTSSLTSSASSTSSTITSSSTVSISHTSAPTSPVTGSQTTPTTSNNASSSGISTAGIVVAVIMSLAVVAAAFVLTWKFYGPVVRWREKRDYERMQERSYRPTLDGQWSQIPEEKGLGISNAGKTNRASVMSFLALGKPKHQIKRKPVPVAPATPLGGTSGDGTSVSPLVFVQHRLPSIASSRAEKDLPSIPEGRRH